MFSLFRIDEQITQSEQHHSRRLIVFYVKLAAFCVWRLPKIVVLRFKRFREFYMKCFFDWQRKGWVTLTLTNTNKCLWKELIYLDKTVMTGVLTDVIIITRSLGNFKSFAGETIFFTYPRQYKLDRFFLKFKLSNLHFHVDTTSDL